MGVEFTCDKCKKSGDGLEAYCADCFSELGAELDEARDEISELKRELEREREEK